MKSPLDFKLINAVLSRFNIVDPIFWPSWNICANNMAQLCSCCEGGGSRKQPVTCTMMEGGPCAACKESAAIYHQIRHEITKLKAKQHILATTMNPNHNPFIHKLPPEIGSRIFEWCLPLLS